MDNSRGMTVRGTFESKTSRDEDVEVQYSAYVTPGEISADEPEVAGVDVTLEQVYAADGSCIMPYSKRKRKYREKPRFHEEATSHALNQLGG